MEASTHTETKPCPSWPRTPPANAVRDARPRPCRTASFAILIRAASALSFLSLSSFSSRARTSSNSSLPPAKSPTSAPPSSNRRRPKLPHLSSFLLSPSDTSPDRRTTGKQGFSGRRPSMAIELHLDVELLAPATIFFVQRLKSKLGEALMLVLSSFLRVPRVSALDSWCRRRRHAVARCELHVRVPAPRCCARRLRPLPRPSRRPTLLLANLAEPPAMALRHLRPVVSLLFS